MRFSISQADEMAVGLEPLVIQLERLIAGRDASLRQQAAQMNQLERQLSERNTAGDVPIAVVAADSTTAGKEEVAVLKRERPRVTQQFEALSFWRPRCLRSAERWSTYGLTRTLPLVSP